MVEAHIARCSGGRIAHPHALDEPFVDDPGDLLHQVTVCHEVLEAIQDQVIPPPPAERA